MSVVVAIDAGTTGVRSVAIDERGTLVGRSYRELPQHYPRPGWVEHDADEIWDATRATLGELTAGLDEPVAAIGITDQRETVLAWDRRTGRPRHRAIVWQDRRTAGVCDRLAAEGHGDLVRRRTGLTLDPYFSATKMGWLLDEGGVEVDDDLALGTIDSWLVWCLTGGATHVTDPSNASRTSLFDLATLEWDDELCELFGVPRRALAEVWPSSGRLGTTVEGTGIAAGVPVSGIAGDQQAALFAQACTQPGMAKCTYGTGSFVLVNAGPEVPAPSEGLVTSVGWQLADGTVAYVVEGSIFVTGAAIQWLRDGLGLIDDAAEIGPLAASVQSSDGVFVVPALTGLGSPWWDPHARGTIVGITRGTTRAHLARAVVEAMAFQVRDVVEAMRAGGAPDLVELRVDGGASVMELLLQLQADQLGCRVARPTVTETTALGSGYLAGLAEGVWSSLGEIESNWTVDVEVSPTDDRSTADAAHRRWLQAVERSFAWDA